MPRSPALKCKHVHGGRPLDCSLGFVRGACFVTKHGNRADQDRAIVEEPVRPAELEEGVGQHRDQAENLGLEGQPRHFARRGQVPQHLKHLVGRTEERETAADGQQAPRREEGGALLQTVHVAGVDHAKFAPRHGPHPGLALAVHRRGERGAAGDVTFGRPCEQQPADQEEGEGGDVGRT